MSSVDQAKWIYYTHHSLGTPPPAHTPLFPQHTGGSLWVNHELFNQTSSFIFDQLNWQGYVALND